MSRRVKHTCTLTIDADEDYTETYLILRANGLKVLECYYQRHMRRICHFFSAVADDIETEAHGETLWKEFYVKS